MPQLAVLGNLTQDRIDGSLRVGGGPFHAARGLRRLDASGVIVTKAAEALLPPLAALGVPVESREARTTPIFAIAYDGDERQMEIEELGEPWTPEDARAWVAGALDGVEWLHVAPVLRSDFPAETLAELARGRRLLLDAQGLVRVPRTGPLREDADYDPETLRHVTVLKLAEEEARIVLPDLSEQSLAGLGVPEVLVTFGSRGSLVWTEEGTARIPARPVEADATGAGDAFSSAYLASRAAGCMPFEAAEHASRLVESLLAGS